MPKKVDYPVIKKALWEAWRVFIPAFSAIIYVQFEAGVDLKDWKAWIPSLVLSAGLAGIKAIVKWIRAKYFAGKYDSFVYKFPV